MLLHTVADAHTEQPAGADGVDALAGLPLHTRGVCGRQAPDAAQTARGVASPVARCFRKARMPATPAAPSAGHQRMAEPLQISIVAKMPIISIMAE